MSIQAFLLVVGVVLSMTGVVLPTANSQVQITQSSSTTNDNGQRISLKTESTSGTGASAQENISIFEDVVGYDDIKKVFRMALKSDEPIHVLLVGPWL